MNFKLKKECKQSFIFKKCLCGDFWGLELIAIKSCNMNCNRCLKTVLPNLQNIEVLSLHYLGIKVKLDTLNCANCRICIYLKTRNDKWTHVDSVHMEKSMFTKNGWETIEEPDELVKFFVLSQVVYNQSEVRFDQGNAFFDFPDQNDLVKILWENGKAIGFYTVKRKESIVFDTMESYEMTTLDTAYILKSHRRKGHGVSILQDLIESFPGEDIAMSTPVSTSMYHVARKFLSKNPSYKTKLWEISGVGSEGNRKLVYFSLKKLFPL